MSEKFSRPPLRTALIAPLCVVAALFLPVSSGFSFWGLSSLIALVTLVEILQSVPQSGDPFLRVAPMGLLTIAGAWFLLVTTSALVPRLHLGGALAWLIGTAAFWACSRAASRRPEIGAVLILVALFVGAVDINRAPTPETRFHNTRARDFAESTWRMHPMTGIGMGTFTELQQATREPIGYAGRPAALAEWGATGTAFALALALLVGLRALSQAHRRRRWWSLLTVLAALYGATMASSSGVSSIGIVILLSTMGAAWGASFATSSQTNESEDQAPPEPSHFYDFPLTASTNGHDAAFREPDAQNEPAATPPPPVPPLPPQHRLSPLIRNATIALVLVALVAAPAWYALGERIARGLPLYPETESEIARAERAAKRFPWSDRAALARANGLARAAARQDYPARVARDLHTAFAVAARRNPLQEETWVAWTDLQRNMGRIREMRDTARAGRAWCAASPRLALWETWAAILLRDRDALEKAWNDAIYLARAARRDALADALQAALARYHERAGDPWDALEAWCTRLLREPNRLDARAGIVRVAARIHQPASGNEKP